MNVRLYSNISAPEVYCNIYNIAVLAIFDYFSKCVFFSSVIGACAKKRDNTVLLQFIILSLIAYPITKVHMSLLLLQWP